jgi:predicted permease
MVGRLAPDLTLAQAQRQLTDVLGRAPGAPAGQAVVLQSLLEGTTASYQSTVNTLAGAVGLILLIACVNVAGLLLAKGATRLPELAIRASIGAGRGRLIRQLLTESLVLAIAGGAAGIAVAWWTLDALVANIPLNLSTNAPAALNVRVLAASAALSLVTGLIFGLAPALRLSRAGVADALARGSRRGGSPLSRRGGQWLIAIEIALALVLLAGAGLMIRSFTRLLDVDLGFHPEQFMTMEVTPVVLSPASLASYYPALLDTIRQLPGVASAGAINQLPLMGSSTVMIARSDTGAPVSVNVRQVLPGYFEAVGLPLEAGRPPSEADRTDGRQAIVINQAAAKILFSDGAALGREFELGLDKGRSEVIGLVHDVRFNGPLWPAAPEVYRLSRPLSDARPGPLVVVVRPTGDARGLPEQLRRVAAGVGPRVLIERIRNGSDWLDDRIVTPKRRTVLLGLLGGLGLVLTLVGIFGMTAYSVARRTHEIGVRMAFGARPADVVRAMVADAAWPVACGVGVGVGGALFATRVISTFLFETTPTDPQTFVAVAATLAATACIAAWIPARRAARVDPVMALRAD